MKRWSKSLKSPTYAVIVKQICKDKLIQIFIFKYFKKLLTFEIVLNILFNNSKNYLKTFNTFF